MSVRTVAKWLARRGRAIHRSTIGRRRPHRAAAAYARRRAGHGHHRRCAGPARRPGRSVAALGIPRSTVTRVLQRAGLNRLRRPRARRPSSSGTNGRTPATCCIWISSRSGAFAASGIASTAIARQRARGVGYEYVHVAIDDATRLAYVEVRRSQRRRACAAFLRNALQWFRRRGITVRRLLDRQRQRAIAPVGSPPSVAPGSCATNSRGLTRHAPTARRSALFKPCCASGPIAGRFSARRSARPRLPRYLRFYNHQRPHASLGRRSPWTRFQEAA